MQQLSWKEKYAAVIVLLMGIVYLALIVVDLSSSKSDAYAVKDGAILIDKNELFNHLRALTTIICGIGGGLLLWRGSRLGWVLGLPLLFIFLSITSAGLVSIIELGLFDAMFGAVIVCMVIILLAIVFLIRPAGRLKYKVGNLTLLPTLLLLAFLIVIYYVLQ